MTHALSLDAFPLTSAASWLWDTAVAEGPEQIDLTARRACAVAGAMCEADGVDGWRELLGWTADSDKSLEEIERRRATLTVTSRVEQIARTAHDAWLLTRQVDTRWWEKCASIVTLSMHAIQAASDLDEVPDGEMIELCRSAVTASPLRALVVENVNRNRHEDILRALSAPPGWTTADDVTPLLERFGVESSRLARYRGMSVSAWWSSTIMFIEQLAALGPLGVDAATRSQLLAGMVRPFLAEVPGARRYAFATLEAAARGCDATEAYELAMSAMCEAHQTCTAVERGELVLVGPGKRHLVIGAIWQLFSACAVVALERAALEVPHTLAESLLYASIGLDPDAPDEAPASVLAMQETHSARLANRMRSLITF